VLEVRRDLRLVDALRQVEGARERAVAALDELVAPFLALLARLAPQAAHGEQPVLDAQLDVVGAHAREVHVEDDLALLLARVDGRGVALGALRRRAAVLLRGVAAEGVLEQAVDLAAQVEHARNADGAEGEVAAVRHGMVSV
jgi:hypothetical protein